MQTNVIVIKKFGRNLCALAPLLLLSPSAAAQNVEGGDVVELSPYLVTTDGDDGYFSKKTLMGTRSTERLVNVPQNIQVINQEFLEDLNLDNGVDAFKYASSGIKKREATSGDTYIRGFRVGGNSFLRDGVSFRGNLNIPLYDVERIEVIKGPAALLFGAEGGSGGVVNYVSRAAAKKPEYSAKLTAGSFSLYRAEASAAGPIAGTDLSYRVTVAATESDLRRKFDHFNDRFFSTSWDYQLSPTSLVSLYYNYIAVDQIVSTETVDNLGRRLDIPDNFSAQESWVNAPRFVQYLSLRLLSEIGPGLQMRLFLNASAHKFDFEQIFAARVPDPATGLMNRTYQEFRGDENRENVQLDFLKSFNTGRISHKLSFGGTGKFSKQPRTVDSIAIAPTNVFNPTYGTSKPVITRGQSGATDDVLRGSEFSSYIQEQMSFLEGRVIVLGGLGFNYVNNQRTNNLRSSVATQVDEDTVARYGAVYKPSDWMSLYYSYAESFSFLNSTFVGGPRDGDFFDPQTTENKEIGLKVETADGRFFGSVVAFDMVKDNVRFNYIQPDGTPGRGQGDLETNKGFEVDLGMSFKIGQGRLQTIVTYYDGNSKDQNGNQPGGVSNRMWSLFATHSTDAGPLQRFKFGGGVYYTDEFPLGGASGQTVSFTAPSYTTSTAFISYAKERWEVALNVDNVFDEDYVEGGDGAGAMNITLGRTFKMSLSYRF